jgi:ankyrin repeat protein
MHSRSPLHCAAKNRRKKCIKFLLQNSAKKTQKIMHSRTPLHNAANNRRTKSIRKLLRDDADNDFEDGTALRRAKRKLRRKKAAAKRRGRYIRTQSTSADGVQAQRQSKTGLQRLKPLAS